jgi:hypothetical protein
MSFYDKPDDKVAAGYCRKLSESELALVSIAFYGLLASTFLQSVRVFFFVTFSPSPPSALEQSFNYS